MDDDPLPLAPPVIPPGEVAGLVPPQYASPAAFHLRREKYMIENGFEVGVRLAVTALAVAGLACILFVGVTAAVLLVLARRLYRGDDDTGDDRQDYQHTVAAEKSAPTKMPRGAGARGASSKSGRDSPAAVAASAPSRRRIM